MAALLAKASSVTCEQTVLLWAVWSSSSVRPMAHIVKSSKSYRLILQWTNLVSTKMKYSLHCGATKAAATICDGTCNTFLICSDSKQQK